MKLGTADACAAIWTHVVDNNGYRITFCVNRVSIDIDDSSQSQTIVLAVLDTPVDSTTWQQLDVLIGGSGITVKLDGEQAVSKARTLPKLPRGTVILGLTRHPDRAAHPAESVTYADVTITSAP